MKRIVYIPLLIGGALFVAGGVLVGCSYAEKKSITTEHDLKDKSFSKISIDCRTSDVEFIVSEDSSKKVVCKESEKHKHEVKVENDTLIINFNRDKKWYEFTDFLQPSYKSKVYLPSSSFESLNLKVSTGDVVINSGFTFENVTSESSTGDFIFKSNVEEKLSVKQTTGDLTLSDVKAGEIHLEGSTGDKNLNNVTCSGDTNIKTSTGDIKINKLTSKNLSIDGSTADVTMTDSVMSGNIKVKVSTGDVKFVRCDGQEIKVDTSTGDVNLNLLTSHDVEAHSSTGKIDYPAHSSGQPCDITTNTGDIKVTF